MLSGRREMHAVAVSGSRYVLPPRACAPGPGDLKRAGLGRLNGVFAALHEQYSSRIRPSGVGSPRYGAVVDLAQIEHSDRTARLNPVIRTVVLTTTEHDQLWINAATATGQESAGLLPDDPSRLRARS